MSPIFPHSFHSSLIIRSHWLLFCLLFQVAEPMQMEFLKMKEARENPSEELQSKSYSVREVKQFVVFNWSTMFVVGVFCQNKTSFQMRKKHNIDNFLYYFKRLQKYWRFSCIFFLQKKKIIVDKVFLLFLCLLQVTLLIVG